MTGTRASPIRVISSAVFGAAGRIAPLRVAAKRGHALLGAVRCACARVAALRWVFGWGSVGRELGVTNMAFEDTSGTLKQLTARIITTRDSL